MLRKIRVFTVCVSLLFAIATNGQVIQTNAKNNPTVDYDRLRRIDTLVNEYIQKDWLKGVVTLVVKDNQLIQYKGYGILNADTKTPMPNDAIFRIMSQTKAITSVAVMILYERGKITLDEPIADFIPEFKNPVVIDKFSAADTNYTTVPAKRDITFRDLLTHSGGLDYAAIGSATGNALYAKAGIPSGLGFFNASLLDRMKALAKLPLLYQPGEKWQYSLSSDLLGCLIEVISGQSLEVFFKENIFDPLGMKDTYFNLRQKKPPAGYGFY